MIPADTTLLGSSSDRRSGAAGTQDRNAAIHPVQRPTSNEESGTSPGFDRAPRRNLTIAFAFAAIVLMALNLRSAVTAVPPLLAPISAAVGLSPTVVGLLGSLPTLAFSAAGLLGVRLLRRFTAERIAVGVLIAEAAGQLVRPWSGGAAGFLTVTALTLVGMGVGNVILPALVKAWFPDRIGMLTAAYVTALAVGTSLPALLAVPIAARLGWQPGLALWGALALLPVPLWLAVAARRDGAQPVGRAGDGGQRVGRAGDGGQRVGRAGDGGQLVGRAGDGGQRDGGHGDGGQQVAGTPHRIAVHRSPISWGLALLFGMNALNLYAMFTWLPVRLVDAGASEARAGALLALFAGVGMVPSLLVPWILGRFGRAGQMVLACVGFFTAGYLGLLYAPMTLTPLWVVLAGLGGGGFPLVLTLFGMRAATPASTGALAGFAQGVGYLAAAGGPLLVGLLHDLTGGWTAPFAFLGVTLSLMALGAWLCCSATGTVEDDLRRRARAGSGPLSTGLEGADAAGR